ncbi:MAG: hypothetical protein A2498_05685 [Lentisphaerae bacterium RIFOXYC12_FULL_60_16]|nr:MAG: hypothetical protein A2498_05685 [Lentisphaerae bacterium RIFOXYC12_FULL_60_16]OGV84174.1 MAG: hypothetical protein A2340_13520 [Lentisphaerae bacterium RIFOXYB12_FULL_60_10]
MFGIIAAHPWFLWMLPLAGLPVLFHLFLRVRKQIRPFPSLMFFLQAEPRLSARKRIREWLALLLRALLIILLILALSRPVWLGHAGSGPVCQVVVIDNSGSMAGPAPDGRPKLSGALDAAAALIADMDQTDSLAIRLLVEDPGAAMPDGLSTDRDALRASLERIKVTQGSGAPARALAHAFSLLEASSTARREIHLFTDLQETEWVNPPRDHRPAPGGASITVYRLTSKPWEGANVVLDNIELPRRMLVADRRYLAQATLHNASGIEARIRLVCEAPGGVKTSCPADVPPNSTRTIGVPFETPAAGNSWLAAHIENDAFEPDNHAAVAFRVQPRRTVLFCGEADRFGVVPLAVSPSGDGTLSGLVPSFRRKDASLSQAFADPPAMVVLPWSVWPGLPDADRAILGSYLEQGGHVLLLPDAGSVSPPARMPPWLSVRYGPFITDAAGRAVMVLNQQAAVWDDLRDDTGEVMLHQIKLFKTFPLQAGSPVVSLLALQDGTPVVVEQRVGKGRCFVSGFAFDSAASTLPLKAGFVAFIHGMVLSGQNPAERAATIVAGGRPPGLEAVRQPVRIRAVAGSVMEWQGPGHDVPALPRAGIYSLETSNVTSYVAVRSSVEEGGEVFLEAESVPALAGLPHRVDAYRNSETLVRQVRRMRTGVDLYLPLLLLALAAVLVEGLVVNVAAIRHPGKSARGKPVSGSIRDRIRALIVRFRQGGF